jgi:transposase
MRPLTAGYRYDVVPSRYGGVDQRWIVLSSEHRPPQAQRSVEKRWLKHRAHEAKALKKLCNTACACEAEAQQAVATFTHGLRSTFLHQVTLHPTPRYGTRGRPSPAAPPARVDDHIAGALASSLSARQQRVSQQSCCLLATNALEDQALSPQAVLEGSQGQQHAERGFRFLKAPPLLASSRSLKKPERIMALLMVMTVCVLVYAA